MKLKIFSNRYEKKIKSIDKKPRRYIDVKWVVTITITAYLLSLLFSGMSSSIVPKLSPVIGVVIVIIIILIGVLFDMIGVAVTACNIAPFNSMATKNIRGSRTAITLIKNAEKVSAFCNDVIGDVCGIISGSVGALIAVLIASKSNLQGTIVTLVITALIASLTIGGKACGKSFAINKSDVIVFKFAKFISIFKKEKKRK